MTALFESLLLQILLAFQKYDEDGYPIDDEYINKEEEELDEDLDDGFDAETTEKTELE